LQTTKDAHLTKESRSSAEPCGVQENFSGSSYLR
jgi:hypothetical protein